MYLCHVIEYINFVMLVFIKVIFATNVISFGISNVTRREALVLEQYTSKWSNILRQKDCIFMSDYYIRNRPFRAPH